MKLLVALAVLLIAIALMDYASERHTPACQELGYDTAVVTYGGVYCEKTERVLLIDLRELAK